MMKTNTTKLGQWGESIAVQYLNGLGYKILSRNYHAHLGEIDIIAVSPGEEEACLVFVEVKTRSDPKHGYPEEAVGRMKWKRISTAIQIYLEGHPENDWDWRVDVIAILGHPEKGDPQIQHYENVVMPDERE